MHLAMMSLALAGILVAPPTSSSSSTDASVAPEPAVDLAWEMKTPAGCDAAAFHRNVAELLPGPPAGATHPLPVRVQLLVDVEGLWSIELWLGADAEHPSRHFESPNCESVLEAAALVVAMELEPNLLGLPGPGEVSSGEEEQGSDGSEGAEFSAEPKSVEAGAPEGLAFGLRVYGGVVGLALPGWTGSVGGGAYLRGRSWRAGLGARYRFATRTQNELTEGGEFSYLAARASACGILRRSALEFPLCGAAEFGQLTADGFGVAAPERSRRPWIALRALPGVSYALSDWFSLSLELDLGLVVSQERYHLAGIGPVHEVGPVEFGLSLGAQFRLFGGQR